VSVVVVIKKKLSEKEKE